MTFDPYVTYFFAHRRGCEMKSTVLHDVGYHYGGDSDVLDDADVFLHGYLYHLVRHPHHHRAPANCFLCDDPPTIYHLSLHFASNEAPGDDGDEDAGPVLSCGRRSIDESDTVHGCAHSCGHVQRGTSVDGCDDVGHQCPAQSQLPLL